MARIVFAVDLDHTTMESLQELRIRRRQVIVSQLEEMDETLRSLEAMGALTPDEKSAYEPTVRADLELKLSLLDERIADSSVFYEDELEFYLDLLRSY